MNTEKAKRIINAWQKSDSLKSAAKAIGVSPAYASRMATFLRSKGIPLKKMHKSEVDWKALAEYTRKIKGK